MTLSDLASTAPSIAAPATPLGLQFARHMELRGRRILQAAGGLWQSVGSGMIISIPPQRMVELTPDQTAALLGTARAIGARFPSLQRPGIAGGLYVVRDRAYGFPHVHRHVRQKVRRGLEHCEIRQVHPEELLRQGLALNLQTMTRQGRFDAEFGTAAGWERVVRAVEAVPAMAATGAFLGTELAAYVITCQEDGCLHIVHQMSRQSGLEECPNHVLDYWVTYNAFQDPAIGFVTMGWSSLLAPQGLHQYKTRLGYSFEPHQNVIQFHPALAPALASRLAVNLAGRAAACRPDDQRLATIAAVVQGGRMTRQEESAVAGPLEPPCQIIDQLDFSRLRQPFPIVLLRRAWRHLRHHGLRNMLRKAQEWISKHWRGPAPKRALSPRPPLEPGLQPGDWVEVKSQEEIAATLDAQGALRGLKFLPDMARYCGQRFRVHKRLETLFLEESRQIRKMSQTVLLDQVYCDGAGYHCDRSCFYYWREAWLRKVSP